MKKIALAAFLMLAAVSGAVAREIKEDVPADVGVTVEGRAVKLAPSDLLQERAAGVKGQFPAYGCDYKIDWGDGRVDPQPYFPADRHCKSNLWHKYRRPGAYLIKIDIYSRILDKSDNRKLEQTGQTWVHLH